MLPVKTQIFLTFSIITEVIRWLILPIHPYAFVVPLHPFCHGLVFVVFLLRHHLTLLWQYSHIHLPEAGKGALDFLGSHTLFPPYGFVTAAAIPVIGIFTSCSGCALSISVGSKCAVLHVLFLHYFNVNMFHVRSCPFSPSKPFTLDSR